MKCQFPAFALAGLALAQIAVAAGLTVPAPEDGEASRGERLSLASSQYDRGVTASRQGRPDLAEELLRDALSIQEELAPASLALGKTLNSLGSVFLEQGFLDNAETFYRRALEIREQLLGDSLEVAASLNNLGIVAINRGDFGLAREYHERALGIKEKLAPDSLTVAASLNNLAQVALYRGESELARKVLQRALAIKEKLAPGSLTVAASLGSLAHVALEQSEPEEASGYLYRALSIRQVLSPEGLEVGHTFNSLAKAALDKGDLEDAQAHAVRALAIQQRLVPESLAEADTLETLGAIAIAKGELDRAREHYQRSLSIGERLAPGGPYGPTILNSLAKVAKGRGELDLAADYFGRSIDALEARTATLGGSYRIVGSFRARYGHCYRDALEFFLDTGRAPQAFAFLERSRARTFLAMLQERDLLFAEVATALEERRRALARRHDRVQGQLWRTNPETEPEQLDQLVDELEEIRREHDDLQQEIRRASPRLGDLQAPRTVDVDGARKALDPGTVMLSYSLGKTRSELFVVSREEGLEVHPLAIGEEDLRREVELFREQIQEARMPSRGGLGPRSFLTIVGKRLFELLVEPAADRIERSARVVLIPDGPLHRFPFAALIRETKSDEAPDRDQYFVEWKPLHYALSATVYAQLQRRDQTDSQPAVSLAAFGDPRYETREPRLPPLPSSRREVQGIAEIYGSREATVYLGENSTEERFKALGSQIRYVHLATHAVIDDRLPLNSGIVLTLPEDSPGDRDRDHQDNGFLQAWEIFESVRFDAELVVLSACGSGLGEERGGEGLISLTRAFQYAGARSVAATLWNVDDRVTAELMLRFYKHLKSGQAKAEALRAAQLDLIRERIALREKDGGFRESDVSAPYYWAAFQLTGDWQ